MEWVAVIGTALSLLIMIFKEVFSEVARQKQADKEFKLDQEKFFALIEGVIKNIREQAKQEAKKAQDLEDQIDAIRRGKK